MRLKFIAAFLCTLLFYGYNNLVNANKPLPDLNDTTPEDLPFHAIVHAKMVCGGILITENYVITPAYCVYRSSSVRVYLGFREYPYYIFRGLESNTQTFRAKHIFIHEDFAEIKDQHYLNNIALIQLSSPAVLSNKIHPGTLISREDTHYLEGRYANISGWFASKDTNMKLATVQIRNEDTCRYLFEDGFLKSQEYCVQWLTKSHVSLLGNPVRVDDKIIGFQTNSPSCVVPSSSCGRNNMVLSFIPFLDWMSHKMNIPIEQFTAKRQGDHDITKIKDAINKINATINKEINRLRKYDSDIASLNETTKTILAQLEASKHTENSLRLLLNEEIGSIKTEISSRGTRVDQNLIELQEELSSVRTEVTGGLIARRSLDDSHAEFVAATRSLQQRVNERINSLDENTRELTNMTINNQIEERERHLQQQQEIIHLNIKLDDINITEAKNQLKLHELFGHVNGVFKNVSSSQSDLNRQVESLKEFKSHVLKEKESLTNVQEKLDDVINTGYKDKLTRQLRFDEIEKVFGDLRHDLDKHSIQEVSQSHLLWGEVKSLNSSVNIILKYIYDKPFLNEKKIRTIS